MKRRKFITLLGGAAAAWPMAARAQQAKMPTIGFLGAGSGSDSVWKDWTAAFVQRLRELGWVEGRTVVIEYRWGDGRAERYADLAAEFVALKVDVIVTSGSKKRHAKVGVAHHPVCHLLMVHWRAEYLVSFADIKRLSDQLSCRAFNYITRQNLMQAK
jgi:hypothetical protein